MKKSSKDWLKLTLADLLTTKDELHELGRNVTLIYEVVNEEWEASAVDEFGEGDQDLYDMKEQLQQLSYALMDGEVVTAINLIEDLDL